MSQRPLGDVLLHTIPEFTPEHPERAPWQRQHVERVQVACTGNLVTVPLMVADRVQLRGLDRAGRYQDWWTPEDWTPQSWGV